MDELPSRAKPETVTNNDNILINVNFFGKSLSDKVDESVFTCFSQNTAFLGLKSTIKKYYVSNEYNISEEEGSYIAGRFVFFKDIRRSKLIFLGALAEEAAKVSFGPGRDLEKHYLHIREKRKRGTFNNLLVFIETHFCIYVCARRQEFFPVIMNRYSA